MILSKESFIRKPRKVVPVDLDDGRVYVRAVTAAEAMDLEVAMTDVKDLKQSTAIQLAAFLSDQDGGALLTVDEALEAIGTRSPADVQAILKQGYSLNSLDAKALEETSGN